MTHLHHIVSVLVISGAACAAVAGCSGAEDEVSGDAQQADIGALPSAGVGPELSPQTQAPATQAPVPQEAPLAQAPVPQEAPVTQAPVTQAPELNKKAPGEFNKKAPSYAPSQGEFNKKSPSISQYAPVQQGEFNKKMPSIGQGQPSY
jgi:hypothetical protein